MIGSKLGHYKIVGRLGKGGMGEVYLAEDSRLNRKVALKVLPSDLAQNPERVARFQREAEALAALDHPNIVPIHSIEQAATSSGQSLRFLTMGLVEGRSLDRLIGRDGLELDRLFDLAMPVADALSAAHEKGITHRDLKPANIMVGEDHRVKVLDFGLAKFALPPEPAGQETATQAVSRDGMVMGTVPYMSPEQLEGKPVDQRTDIFSLGVLLYEAATGHRPFAGDSSASLISSILRDTPDPVTDQRADLPRHLGRIIRRCLEKEPAARYQTARDVYNELRGLRREVRSGEHPTGVVAARPAGPGRRSPLRTVILTVIAASAVFLTGWYLLALFDRASGPTDDPSSIAGTQATAKKMIVVLPFENLGPPDEAYFAAGMTEEITSRLAAVRSLGVISRTSAVQYDRTGKTVRQIGEDLGVDYVLEGTVRWDRREGGGSRVRVTPQLVSVADDTHVWAERYDEALEDIFAVQTRIAEEVLESLNVALLGNEQDAVASRPTENLEAYQAYLRGLEVDSRNLLYSLDDRQLQIDMFERAVELDPQFAIAWARLSMAHANMINLGMDRSPARLVSAKAAVDRALELQPGLAEAHLALGYYHYWGFRDYESALAALTVAERGMPNRADLIEAFGWIRRRQGRWDEALDYAQRAFALNPRDASLAREIGNTLTTTRRYPEALEFYDRSIALAPGQDAAYAFKAMLHWLSNGDLDSARTALEAMPASPQSVFNLFWVIQEALERDYDAALSRLDSLPRDLYVLPDQVASRTMTRAEIYSAMGDRQRALDAARLSVDWLEREVERLPGDHRYHAALGFAYAMAGRREEAIREGKRAVELYPASRDALHGPVQHLFLAQIYATVGEAGPAVEQLDYLLSIPSFVSVSRLRGAAVWDPIRDDPRFQELLEKYE